MRIGSLQDGFMLHGGGVISLVGAGGKTTLMFRLASELFALGKRVLTTTTTKIYMPAPDQSPRIIVAETPEAILRNSSFQSTSAFHFTAAARHDAATGKLIGFSPEIIHSLWDTGSFDWIIVEADGAARHPLKAPADHEPVIPDCTDILIAVVGLDAIGNPLTDSWVFRPDRYSALSGIAAGNEITPESVATVLLHPEGIMKGAPARAKRFVFLNKAETEPGRNAGRKIMKALTGKQPDNLSGILMGSADHPESALEYQFASDDWPVGSEA